ncbi:hypothetical protein K2X05_03090, partial [bacterium]|nr:hypothetical protein [bacterium]
MGKIIFCFIHFVSAADTYQLSYQLSNDTGDFKTFTKMLEKANWSSPEEFLKDWKNQKPEFFSNY